MLNGASRWKTRHGMVVDHKDFNSCSDFGSRAPKRRYLASLLAHSKLPKTESQMDVESQRLVRNTSSSSRADDSTLVDLGNEHAPVRSKGLKAFLEGPFVLLMVAVFWGTFSPALKALYETPGPPDPAMLTAVRTTIQAGGLWVVSIILTSQGITDAPVKDRNVASHSLIWRAGLEMGFWNFVANSFQAYETVARQQLRLLTWTIHQCPEGVRSMATSILTPLLAVLAGEWPSVNVWVASVVALGSTMLVAADSPDSSQHVYGLISGGDAAVFGAAFFYSVATVRLTHWAQQLPTMKLASSKSVMLAGFSLVWLVGVAVVKLFHGEDLVNLWAGAGGTTAWLLVLWSALGAGTTSIYLQTLGQSKASSGEAQIYYSTTPIWGALLALCFMGETMGAIGWVGGGGLIIAGLLASFEPF